MNRKKTIDYTVTRRPRDSYSQVNASKSRDERGRSDGDRDKKPFWSKDDKNVGNESQYSTFQISDKREETFCRDAVLKDLQDEISRAVLPEHDADSYSRGRARGPILDEFSEDAYDLHSSLKSNRMEFRDDQQHRQADSRKRSYSPVESSYRQSREDTSTKRSCSSNSGSHRGHDDDDLRNVLKQYQKSKWDDEEDASKEWKRYDGKDRGSKLDGKRNKNSLGVSSPSDMFTMSSQGTLVSLPLEPLSDNRDYFDSDFSRDYRDEDQQHGDKHTSGDSVKDRDRRDSRDCSSSRYKHNRRGSLDDGLRSLSNDLDNRDSRYKVGSHDAAKEIGHLLHQYRESSHYESGDTLRDLSLPVLAGKAGEKYKSGFELGRPFFGLAHDNQGKEQGWQDPNLGGEPKGDDMWNVHADILDQRNKDYGTVFGNDDFLAERDGQEVTKDGMGSKQSSSKPEQRDAQGNSYYKDNKNNKRGGLALGYKPPKIGPITTSNIPWSTSSIPSTTTTPKVGPKPLFPSGFMPRQVKMPSGKKAQKPGANKGSDSPPLLSRKSGYFPRNTDLKSMSPSRSSERGENSSSLKGEVKPSSKGKFTAQNWSGLESNDRKQQSKVNNSLISPQGLGSTRGRGNKGNNRGNRGRGGGQRGATRGRGFRGRGAIRGNRGRGFTPRGRGLVLRGRGRGQSQPGHVPVGATVRNIFRRSRSPSPADGKYRKSLRSSVSPRRGRSRRRRGSRSRSSSYCSTCSSGSCSTCHSWRSISVDSLSGKGDKDKKKHSHHREKSASNEGIEKKSAKLDKLKADVKDMEKQLEQKKVKDVSVKKLSEKKPEQKSSKDASKSKLDPKSSKDESMDVSKSKVGLKSSKDVSKSKMDPKATKDGPKSKLDPKTTRDVPKNKMDPKTIKDVSKSKLYPKNPQNVSKVEVKEGKGAKMKDEKGSLKDVIVKEEKIKSSFDTKKELKKKTDNSREVIFKSDKRKESPLVKKKEKDSPAREVKIVSEKKSKDYDVLDDKLCSKMKVHSLKITIDQPERVSDTKKNKTNGKEDERRFDEREKSSKSPPGKQKKKDKEKLKPKKGKKKSKKRKHDKDSSYSGDDSVYSSISGQDEYFSSYDDKFKYMQPSYDERIVEFSSGGYDSNKITVHYAKRKENNSSHANSRKLSEGEGSKSAPTRTNLITIPLPKEPEIPSKSGFRQNVIRAPLSQEGRQSYPLRQGGKDEERRNAPHSETSYTGNDSSVDWETGTFAGEQDYDVSYQGTEAQDWAPGQEEGGEYYYQEGAESEGYEQEYYEYPQEEAWPTGEQAEGGYQEEEYQEWCEGEYPQEGVEGEAGAEYKGEYYLGEDGLYYPVEGEAYEQYQGEYVEGGAEGLVEGPEQGVVHAEEGYGYQYVEGEGEWQQYEEGGTCQTEEGWVQGEVEGQWEEYQEGFAGAESEWGTEYVQGNEYEAAGQEYAAEGEAPLLEGYSTGEGYDQQLAPEQYYTETYPSEHGFEPQQGDQEAMESIYTEEPVASNDNARHVSDTAHKPLKSILKRGKPAENKGTKLVSERLAQMKNQATSKIEMPLLGGALGTSIKTAVKTEENAGQEAAANVQSESERYREMEEAILSSQPKDAIGTEYIVRVHESGTATFFCKLCKCHFNTLTAKNLHVKGMKHIELYIRLKSSLLQTVIKDTKIETSKRPADEDPSGMLKVPRRF